MIVESFFTCSCLSVVTVRFRPWTGNGRLMIPSYEKPSGTFVSIGMRAEGMAATGTPACDAASRDGLGSSLSSYAITLDRRNPMKTFKSLCVLAALSLLQGSVFAQARYIIIHNFAGGANDGANPQGDLTISGTTCYGTTYAGGSAGLGTVFKVNTDGTGFVCCTRSPGAPLTAPTHMVHSPCPGPPSMA